ncbi:MAG: hypothetical protein N2109_12745 [Fimbriimonadales bacterium]|nr:hypothetical protein [Fimbriimonadales bacterium]
MVPGENGAPPTVGLARERFDSLPPEVRREIGARGVGRELAERLMREFAYLAPKGRAEAELRRERQEREARNLGYGVGDPSLWVGRGPRNNAMYLDEKTPRYSHKGEERTGGGWVPRVVPEMMRRFEEQYPDSPKWVYDAVKYTGQALYSALDPEWVRRKTGMEPLEFLMAFRESPQYAAIKSSLVVPARMKRPSAFSRIFAPMLFEAAHSFIRSMRGGEAGREESPPDRKYLPIGRPGR